jgi:hypothetical protein
MAKQDRESQIPFPTFYRGLISNSNTLREALLTTPAPSLCSSLKEFGTKFLSFDSVKYRDNKKHDVEVYLLFLYNFF